MRFLLKYLSVAVLLFFTAFPLYSGTTGKLVGKVTDATTGEALPGVNVYLENTSFGAATDIDGNYLIIGIRPGTYTLVVSYISYREVRVEGVEINIDKTRRVDVKLQPATLELGETIVVEADRPLFRKDLTSTESSVGKETIEALPVENLQEVVNLQAGVVNGHFRGGRIGEVLYMINGIPINDVYSGSYALEVENNSIQELNVISGTFNAEYGQAMSGVVNVVTKEGGTKPEFNLSLYAGSYLTDHDNIFWNKSLAPIYDMQFTAGGPFIFFGDKLRYFMSGRYNHDPGYIYGKEVFLPTDRTTDFLLKDQPEERQFMSHGKMYQFSEELAKKLINDAKAVSMNRSERLSGNIKITYRITPGDKLNFETMYQKRAWRQYDHRFRLNPDGDYRYKQWTINNSLSWNHVFSARTFIDVYLSYFYTNFKQHVYEDPYDSRYVVKERLQDTGANAFVSGGQQMWQFDRSTLTQLFKSDLTSQVNNNHQVKIGVEAKRHRLWLHEFEVLPDQPNRIAPLTSFQNNKYLHYPFEFSGYIQDKMEYEDLIINAGLRFDYFNPDAVVPENFIDPGKSPKKKAESSMQFSPRLGLAYPISANGAIHVSYGHFFQTPNYFYLYTNPEFDIDPLQSSVSPPPQSLKNTIGNANLKPQRTTIYELGFQQQIGDLYGISLTVYFKDIRNLLGTEVYQTLEGIRYGRYINRDYGFVRGVTLDIEKRYSAGFAVNFDYTFQVAKGNASDPNNAFLDAQANKETVKQLVPLNWDRRHQINASLQLGTPQGILASMIARYGTGMPYTQASRVVQPLVENGGRKPDEFTVDLYLYKKFNIGKFNYSFFVKIYNLFDRLNELNVFRDTGRATYSTEPLYFGGGRPRGLNTLEDYYIHPEYYSQPRRVQIGVQVGF
ncbi:MAG: TonB-dependent receptor [Calditrichaeota bacterium]|nr:TonB-dependent receptor [Calditrichota bacterium]